MMTRRELLHTTTMIGGGTVLAQLFPGAISAYAQQPGAAPADPIAAMRAQTAMAPIERVQLANNLVMLSGPGGNVVILYGADGKVVVDTFVQGVFGKLREHTARSSRGPITTVIDTHWHFDHTDNNADFRAAGAQVVAHENTTKRMSQTNNLLGMTFPPSPANALPTQTFKDTHTVTANGETVELAYIPPAHTDTDISVHFRKANVLHLGDVFFNGIYPFIDASTGGRINGMIDAADRVLKMVNAQTRIVPGHGPLADRTALMKSRDMLATVRDRVQKLKTAGRSLEQVVAAKPTADLDAVWGKGFMMPNDFVGIVYNTL